VLHGCSQLDYVGLNRSIPADFARLQHMERLSISHCSISGGPFELLLPLPLPLPTSLPTNLTALELVDACIIGEASPSRPSQPTLPDWHTFQNTLTSDALVVGRSLK
jgi:hypothetical protein